MDAEVPELPAAFSDNDVLRHTATAKTTLRRFSIGFLFHSCTD